MPSARQIRAARKRLGESQAEFGRRFGVDQSTVSRWETEGMRSASGPAKIAVAKAVAEVEHGAAA